MRRAGLVIHPTRDIDGAVETLERWTRRHDIELVQLDTGKQERSVAPAGDVDGCDLVVAVGGDGTVLTALRAAAPEGTPVLGVACGSLGALAAVTAGGLDDALDRYRADDWTRWDLPALDVRVDGELAAWALNDFVAVRRAGQQMTAELTIGGELYARIAGDGVVAATLLGSSAYSLAARGPLLVSGVSAFVVTPLTAHGGSVPPAVIPAGMELGIDVNPGFGGFDVEIDGHTMELDGTTFTLSLAAAKGTLVGVDGPQLAFTALRRRGLIADSPRVLAREEREKSADEQSSAPPA